MRGLFIMLTGYLFLIVFIKAYVVGTHLNCFGKYRQIQMSTHNICFFKDIDTNTWAVT